MGVELHAPLRQLALSLDVEPKGTTYRAMEAVLSKHLGLHRSDKEAWEMHGARQSNYYYWRRLIAEALLGEAGPASEDSAAAPRTGGPRRPTLALECLAAVSSLAEPLGVMAPVGMVPSPPPSPPPSRPASPSLSSEISALEVCHCPAATGNVCYSAQMVAPALGLCACCRYFVLSFLSLGESEWLCSCPCSRCARPGMVSHADDGDGTTASSASPEAARPQQRTMRLRGLGDTEVESQVPNPRVGGLVRGPVVGLAMREFEDQSTLVYALTTYENARGGRVLFHRK